MCAVTSLLLQKQYILMISLTDFFDATSRRYNDIIRYAVSGNDFVFQQNSALTHRTPCVS